MKYFSVLLLFLLLVSISIADELRVLETYFQDDWISFSPAPELRCFLDSSGSFYALYTLNRESEWPQCLLRYYPPGLPARGDDLTGWGPGAWWRPKVCRIDGDQIEMQLSRGTDFIPMPIEHKLVTYNYSTDNPARIQHTRIVMDTELSHLRKTSDTMVSAFSVDYSIWETVHARFLKNIGLYDRNGWLSYPITIQADTLWESPIPIDHVYDIKVENSETYAALYRNYSGGNWGFICLNNDYLMFEVDSLFPPTISNLVMRNLGGGIVFTWVENDDIYVKEYDIQTTSFTEAEVFYTSQVGSLNSVAKSKLVMDAEFCYLQIPVLIDQSSSNPSNWRAIVRQVLSRVDHSLISRDTVIVFGESTTYADHAMTVKDGIPHSLIAADEGAESHLYYYGPLDVVSVEPDLGHPHSCVLSGAYPNPFNGTVHLDIVLDQASSVQLQIYDIQGRRIHSQSSRPLLPGKHQLSWTGISDGGGLVPSGVYILRILTREKTFQQKVLLLK